MVATDRISAFDVILKNKVTNKGKVLTQMSKFWFDYTRDLLPNHMLSVDVKEMPEFFRQPRYEGRSMMCRKLTMLPVECIVRGYLTGSGKKTYDEKGRLIDQAVTDEVEYMTADVEDEYVVAQANEPLDETKHFKRARVSAAAATTSWRSTPRRSIIWTSRPA